MKMLKILSLMAIAYSWAMIFVSMLLNPWFVFQEDAFSALGSDFANYPFIYNIFAMIGTGIIITFYSVYAIYSSRNKFENTGYSFLFISGIFLMLIGIYHSGTRPHTFVSSWFFIESLMSFFIISFGLIRIRKIKLGLALLTLMVISPIIAYIIPWQSVAETEAYGIFVIDIAYAISYISFRA